MAGTLTRWLVSYATVVTALVAVTAVTRRAPGNQEFNEISVHRINIVEPDGTLRMVNADHARLPGVIVRGKEERRIGDSPGCSSTTTKERKMAGWFSVAIAMRTDGLSILAVLCLSTNTGLAARWSNLRA
jgi:hypothetical protein